MEGTFAQWLGSGMLLRAGCWLISPAERKLKSGQNLTRKKDLGKLSQPEKPAAWAC